MSFRTRNDKKQHFAEKKAAKKERRRLRVLARTDPEVARQISKTDPNFDPAKTTIPDEFVDHVPPQPVSDSKTTKSKKNKKVSSNSKEDKKHTKKSSKEFTNKTTSTKEDKSEIKKPDSNSEEISKESISESISTKEEMKPEMKKPNKNDVSEGKTIFIQNLPISKDDINSVVDYIVENYGEIEYFKQVPAKSVGFIKFNEEKSLNKCLADTRGNILTIESTQFKLNISRAESRKAVAHKRLERGNKSNNANNNIHLLLPGDKLTELQNMANKSSFIVNPLRLCIKNLPKKCTEQELKNILLLKSNKDPRVIKSKIKLRHTDNNKHNVGYGFINTKSEADSRFIRKLINDLAKAEENTIPMFKQKLIECDFAIENRKIFERLEKLKEKISVKNKKHKEVNKTDVKKKSRGKQQREKRRLLKEAQEVDKTE